MKSQAVRLVDVVALGPFMVWAGMRSSSGALPELARGLLVVAGVATIVYNGRNYLELASSRGP